MTRAPYSYRHDPAVPPFPDEKPVIVFDGTCVLCSGWARFVLRHDRTARYRLLTAQSPLGQALYRHFGADADETNMLLEDGVAWFKSEGSIRMAEGLGFPWSLARGLRLLPLRLRDALYGLLARNRFRIFGRHERCVLPDPSVADRFLA